MLSEIAKCDKILTSWIIVNFVENCICKQNLCFKKFCTVVNVLEIASYDKIFANWIIVNFVETLPRKQTLRCKKFCTAVMFSEIARYDKIFASWIIVNFIKIVSFKQNFCFRNCKIRGKCISKTINIYKLNRTITIFIYFKN